MKLDRIIASVGVTDISGNPGREIADITFDSRKVGKDSLFVAVSGTEADGHKFIQKAIEAGASVIVYEDGEFEGTDDVTFIKVANSRKALALMADNFFGHPSGKLHLVGITGTNGKTTTVTLLYNLFTALGYCCGLISTIVNKVGVETFPTAHTTPDPMELNALLKKMVDRGCQYCFMEVSSHSIDQDRIAGLEYKVAIFSNLTHDHLDYHKTFAAYRDCKKKFFDSLGKDSFALFNADDRNGGIMVQNTAAKIKSYSCRSIADFHCRIIEQSIEGMQVEIDGERLWSRFIGAHNAYNLLAVYGTAVLLGADRMEVLVAMSALGPVDGRLEYIRGGNDITAVVDYAHTPDALENALKTLREAGRDRCLVCVFGCGGNRDTTKRPEMGAIAGAMADKVFVTSDNPRKEDPQQIIMQIKAGMDIKAKAKSLFITDRREAIRAAIMTAPRGAIILVAGKGHEDYQIIGETKHHFDDKEVISETFKELE